MCAIFVAVYDPFFWQTFPWGLKSLSSHKKKWQQQNETRWNQYELLKTCLKE